ncbi:MAG TPA: WecB/TagA/CpsF family glycosyltransferase [Bacteroidota bacterium]|jgi:N-acetylglucosaminyldiphosphoundecaprenol N-acetyl-beta-D-mannosaminyltransferase
MRIRGQNGRRVYILGARVDNTTSDRALSSIRWFVNHHDGRAREVFFTNVHSIFLSRRNRDFHRHLNDADLVLPDGSGLRLAGRILKTPIAENLNGTDFTPKVLREAETKGWSVYFLGAHPSVIGPCLSHVAESFPNLRIAGAYNGYFSPEEEPLIIEEINSREPDILLVALGSPNQELWIARHAGELKTAVCLAVGGLFDFLARIRRRAPLWMRKLGLEWVYRLLQDPRTKWQRVFIEIPYFLLLLAGRKLGIRPLRSSMLRKAAAS